MTNREVARRLDRIADMLQIKDDNPFKIRAYRKAADAIYHLDEDISYLRETARIADISGIGKTMQAIIEEMLDKGSCEYYDTLSHEISEGLLEMLALPGIGYKTVKTIYEHLGIDNLDDLLRAANEHRIRNLPGMGSKTEYNIKKGMDLLRKKQGKATLGLALPMAEDFRDYILSSGAVEKAAIVGSLRRGKSLVTDIDILAASSSYDDVYRVVNRYKGVKAITGQDENCIRGQLDYQLAFEVIIVAPADYYYNLLRCTGSKEHWKAMDEIIAGIGLNGLDRIESEQSLYEKIGMSYMPPEIRENRGEIEAAQKNELPALVGIKDIKGDLHTHSRWSDGAHEIHEMVEAAKALGYKYMAVTDHSRSLAISRGLNEERLKAQGQLIDNMDKESEDILILKGSEVDILKDGSLDFDDDLLQQLDIVVASIHSNFNFDREKQTERILKAIKNQHVDIIGHLTGRLLNRRNGYELDIEKILETAAANNTILEINAHPDRLDIDEEIARKAKDMGIKIAINSDAHNKEDLNLMPYGVINARRAWLESSDVINTWSVEDVLGYIKE